MTIAIRRVAGSELDALLALYRHLHATDAPLPARDDIEAVWASIRQNPMMECFGVFKAAALVSSCTLVVVPNLTRGCRPYGLIENVVTHPEYRRQGHGRAVLDHALAHAWRAGCYKVMLMTGRKDEATLRFYEAAGFDGNAKQGFIARPE